LKPNKYVERPQTVHPRLASGNVIRNLEVTHKRESFYTQHSY
jgi:hypothetical protein